MNAINLNGAQVTRTETTIFIALPREAWTPIAGGGCCCEYCSEDGKAAPAFWDTLAVAIEKRHQAPVSDTAWTVHYPELHGLRQRR
jgi:hypothetical protein